MKRAWVYGYEPVHIVRRTGERRVLPDEDETFQTWVESLCGRDEWTDNSNIDPMRSDYDVNHYVKELLNPSEGFKKFACQECAFAFIRQNGIGGARPTAWHRMLVPEW